MEKKTYQKIKKFLNKNYFSPLETMPKSVEERNDQFYPKNFETVFQEISNRKFRSLVRNLFCPPADLRAIW